jgi:hypothetical protein
LPPRLPPMDESLAAQNDPAFAERLKRYRRG